ncbi:MAG: hypothetical protein KDB14_17905 [Planctomycetales bacterium]|nr:hypothetical protein [Planctomycetales bacterium]
MSIDKTIQQHLHWLNRGTHRLNVLEGFAVAEQASRVAGEDALPDQATLLTGIGLEQGSSAYGNGRLAILGLIERGFVINEAAEPRRYALRINWEQVRIYSDWLEEHGRPRLVVERHKPV